MALGSSIEWTGATWNPVTGCDKVSPGCKHCYAERYVPRIDALRTTGARVKFLSLEPLLGPLPGLDLRGIDWVIVGGESGPHAREMDPAWVRDLRGQCERAGVAFFFKQWGGPNKKRTGRELDGRTWDELLAHAPATRQVRLPIGCVESNVVVPSPPDVWSPTSRRLEFSLARRRARRRGAGARR